MSSPAVNPQPEPTMEEILASIRKIISEDQAEPPKPAAPPAPVQAAEPEPEPEPAPPAEPEVLELTDEVPAEEAAPEPAPPAPVQEENDIAFAADPAPAEAAPPDADDLISDTTRTAVDSAFATMNQGSGQTLPFAAGTLDALFVHAVQGAFQPTLNEWIDANRAEIMNAMKPLIRTWMDEHLPPLIEAAIAKEIARAAAESSHKR
jgi:uncharacterized protein